MVVVAIMAPFLKTAELYKRLSWLVPFFWLPFGSSPLTYLNFTTLPVRLYVLLETLRASHCAGFGSLTFFLRKKTVDNTNNSAIIILVFRTLRGSPFERVNRIRGTHMGNILLLCHVTQKKLPADHWEFFLHKKSPDALLVSLHAWRFFFLTNCH